MRCNDNSIGECNTILIACMCIVKELRTVWLSDVTNCLYKNNSMNCFDVFYFFNAPNGENFISWKWI